MPHLCVEKTRNWTILCASKLQVVVWVSKPRMTQNLVSTLAFMAHDCCLFVIPTHPTSNGLDYFRTVFPILALTGSAVFMFVDTSFLHEQNLLEPNAFPATATTLTWNIKH